MQQSNNMNIPEEKYSNTSVTPLANKVACVTHTVLVSLILVFAIFIIHAHEVFTGPSDDTLDLLVTAILAYLPVALGWILFLRDRKDARVKYILVCGFLILHAFLGLRFARQDAFGFTYITMALLTLVLVAAMFYNDLRFVHAVGVCVIAENIICTVITAVRWELAARDEVAFAIQFLFLLVIVGFFLALSHTYAKFQQARISLADQERERADKLLGQILSMSENVDSVTAEMTTLSESVSQNMDAISEVSTDTAESAEAIRDHLKQAEDIQGQITDVKLSSSSIFKDVRQTTEAVSEGRRLVHNLKELAATSETAGNDAASALRSLRGHTDQINMVTELITNVASQTSLLSLKASIEAARAGEANESFGEIAFGISNLADQTATATEEIVSLVGSLSGRLQTMIDTTDKLIRTNQEQSDSAGKTAETFETISDGMANINSQSTELDRIIKELASANKNIASHIQAISTITEEVSAHTNKTFENSERNQEVVEQVNSLVQQSLTWQVNSLVQQFLTK